MKFTFMESQSYLSESKKTYKYLTLFLGGILSIFFSLLLPVVPTEDDTFGTSIWIIYILLIPYLSGLFFYALIKKKIKANIQNVLH